MAPSKLIPLIVACALFMQSLDTTALTTALPAMAVSFGMPVLRIHLVVTSYMLSLAAFIPLSGWVADKFGAKRVFCLAIGLFVLSSFFCGLTNNLDALIFWRFWQGVGGALMIPVARLILVKSIPKRQLVAAIALTGLPSLIGPLLGPLLGGVFTTYATWHWVFWINIPVGIVGIIMVLRFIPEIKEVDIKRFDLVGSLLCGVGLAALLFGLDMMTAGHGMLTSWAYTLGGVGLMLEYVWHARRSTHPVMDLRLLKIDTLRASMTGGALFRIGVGATPYLLPLMLQQGFGYTAMQSGSATFVAALGSLGIRTGATKVLRRFGFRNILVWNGLLAAVLLGACALLTPSTPYVILLGVIFLGGFFRSLEFTAINSIAFADVTPAQTSHANSLAQMAQRLSLTLGVTLPSAILAVMNPTGHLSLPSFAAAFGVVALIMASGSLVFAQLDKDAGRAFIEDDEA